jgi:hypothetical protein
MLLQVTLIIQERIMRRSFYLALPFIICLGSTVFAAELDGAKIDQLTGGKGTLNKAEGVYKVNFPRNDVKVTVDGMVMPPFMGLTSWAGFKSGEKVEAMVMGDIVLFQDEVNPAMSAALDGGLWVTALHNHFFFDDPKVYFMHIGGEGSLQQLASGVKKVMDAVKAVREQSPQPATKFDHKPLPEKSAVTAAPLDEIFGSKGTAKDGMYKAVFGRTTKMPCDCIAGKELGVNTWAAFYGADDHALVDGDFAVVEGELQTVLKTLRSSGINIVAIHSHMENENPRIIFLHYWGIGSASDLARAVHSALNVTKK